ncbi:MAG: hypothetical protein AABX54_01400 [Nanoarchaeota archaeon]
MPQIPLVAIVNDKERVEDLGELLKGEGMDPTGFVTLEKALPSLMSDCYDLILYNLYTAPGLDCRKVIPDIDAMLTEPTKTQLGLHVVRQVRSRESMNQDTPLVVYNILDINGTMPEFEELRRELEVLKVVYSPDLKPASDILSEIKYILGRE